MRFGFAPIIAFSLLGALLLPTSALATGSGAMPVQRFPMLEKPAAPVLPATLPVAAAPPAEITEITLNDITYKKLSEITYIKRTSNGDLPSSPKDFQVARFVAEISKFRGETSPDTAGVLRAVNLTQQLNIHFPSPKDAELGVYRQNALLSMERIFNKIQKEPGSKIAINAVGPDISRVLAEINPDNHNDRSNPTSTMSSFAKTMEGAASRGLADTDTSNKAGDALNRAPAGQI